MVQYLGAVRRLLTTRHPRATRGVIIYCNIWRPTFAYPFQSRYASAVPDDGSAPTLLSLETIIRASA
jgi:hypothetical protein